MIIRPIPAFMTCGYLTLQPKNFFGLAGTGISSQGCREKKLLQNLCPKAMGRTERAWSIAANVLTAQTETK